MVSETKDIRSAKARVAGIVTQDVPFAKVSEFIFPGIDCCSQMNNIMETAKALLTQER